MRLTRTHLLFWLQHNTPEGLARLVEKPSTPISVHECINSHAAWKPSHENTIHLLRLHRATAIKMFGPEYSILRYLMELGAIGWSFHNMPRRAAWARRWARRIAKAHSSESYFYVCRELATAEATAQYRAGRPTSAYHAPSSAQEE